MTSKLHSKTFGLVILTASNAFIGNLIPPSETAEAFKVSEQMIILWSSLLEILLTLPLRVYTSYSLLEVFL